MKKETGLNERDWNDSILHTKHRIYSDPMYLLINNSAMKKQNEEEEKEDLNGLYI